MNLRRLKRTGLFGFASYGFLWTLVESVAHFLPAARPSGPVAYGLLVVSSLSFGVWRAWPPSRVRLRVPHSDSTVGIEFGDLLTKSGCVAVQVNEFFDSLLGDHVSPHSLHGAFISRVLRGQAQSFDALVAPALSGRPFEEVPRPSGNGRRFPIGTTAAVDVGATRYLLFALARTDVKTLKASASVHDLWDALAGLWTEMRIRSNGEAVFMPLVGSGLSGVGLPEPVLLGLLLTSFAYHTKTTKITSRLTIVLSPHLKDHLDLSDVHF